MTEQDLRDWIRAYVRAWRTPGTEPLRELFAPDATYRPGPYDAPKTGHDEIAEFWEAERDGPDEAFTLHWQPVAVQDRTAVARVEVRYDAPRAREYRDLWIVSLDGAGRATAFEEWPFHPGQPLVDRRP